MNARAPTAAADAAEAAGLSRVQLALNVTDLEAAVTFYSQLFGTTPAKRRPGYANFAIVEPPLKLVLIEGGGQGGTLNHLGVEVENTAAVKAATDRLTGEGMLTRVEDKTTCCYAVQDKVWVTDPDRAPWEVYAVLQDAEAMASGEACEDGCCS